MTQTHLSVEWRRIPRFPDYDVSSTGEIRRNCPGMGTWKNRILSSRSVTHNGYIQMRLRCNGETISVRLASVVARVFIGERPDGLEINHIDGNKRNNAASNLEYITSRENHLHSFRLGLSHPNLGEKCGTSKLTEANVKDIRALMGRGVKRRIIAAKYSIDMMTVSHIFHRRRWPHVK